MFTKQNAADFGFTWQNQRCDAGGVRISMPHIPHGAHGPSTGERITVLPWYVGLSDDNEHSEVLEAGTRTQLTIAHRDLVKPPATP